MKGPELCVVRVRAVANRPEKPIAVVYNVAFGRSTLYDTALELARRVRGEQLSVHALRWRRVCDVGHTIEDLDRWCLIERCYAPTYVGVLERDVQPGYSLAALGIRDEAGRVGADALAEDLTLGRTQPDQLYWTSAGHSCGKPDAWCVARIENVVGGYTSRRDWQSKLDKRPRPDHVDIRVQEIQARDPDAFVDAVDKALKRRQVKRLEAELAKIDAAQEARAPIAEVDPPRTIDELCESMAITQRFNDTQANIDPEHHRATAITDEQRRAWKSRLAVKVHESEERRRRDSEVLIDLTCVEDGVD